MKEAVEAVKQRLIDYGETKKDIKHQKERLERLELRMHSIGSPNYSGMPKDPSPSSSREADLVCEKVDLEEDIRQQEAWLKREREDLNKIIRKLRSADERAVIRMRYIDGEKWCDVLFGMFGDKEDYFDKEEAYTRRMYNIHGSALLNMARYLGEGGSGA